MTAAGRAMPRRAGQGMSSWSMVFSSARELPRRQAPPFLQALLQTFLSAKEVSNQS